MKLTPLPLKFSEKDTTSSITISPKEETSSFNTSKVPNSGSLASTTVKPTISKPTNKSTNYILPLILVGGGVWYLMK